MRSCGHVAVEREGALAGFADSGAALKAAQSCDDRMLYLMRTYFARYTDCQGSRNDSNRV